MSSRKLGRRGAAFSFAILLALATLVPAARAQGVAPASLVGVRAVYQVTATTKFPDGSAVTRTQRLDNTVTGQQADRLTVHSVVTEDGATQDIDYSVPLDTVIRPLPGQQVAAPDRVSFALTRTLPAPDAAGGRLSQTGESDGLWVRKVTMARQVPQAPEFTLQVELLQTGGPAPRNTTRHAGEALWLLPSLVPPNSGVQVLRASPAPTIARPPAGRTVRSLKATPRRATRSGAADPPAVAAADDMAEAATEADDAGVYKIGAPLASAPAPSLQSAHCAPDTQDPPDTGTSSELLTRDNPPVNYRVWLSRLRMSGWRENDQFCFYELSWWYETGINWTLDGQPDVHFGDVYAEYGDGFTNAHFFGVFPLAGYESWKGHATHHIRLYATTNNTWLHGKHEVYDHNIDPAGAWRTWWEHWFHNGGTYNNGGQQNGCWYVVPTGSTC